MADLLFVAITVMFFALCAGYVSVCSRLVGDDPGAPQAAPEAGAGDADAELVTAS
jgi:hypothetical protein